MSYTYYRYITCKEQWFSPTHHQLSSSSIDTFLVKLKHSLSLCFVHFYPLAGRIVTQRSRDDHAHVVQGPNGADDHLPIFKPSGWVQPRAQVILSGSRRICGLVRAGNRVLHFLATSLATIKDKANQKCGRFDLNIASFQAMSALLWRSITPAQN
ncbi:hypothetical protein Cgig2_009634 [Carnegiea gigantea]|uniref:Uncharacterized protein n=1 Tax=Carnegiea gigantea TaxID=171969 RepID=A0A9Q1JTM4_9CARY|nr:hypothetical protein Cgig2_009634 [Carnegiea gigantea]